jgi:hypothetical protein
VSRQYPQSKRSLGVYPETSKTSEEEDQCAFYASRGASVCSVLLHTITQIDSARIPEAPCLPMQSLHFHRHIVAGRRPRKVTAPLKPIGKWDQTNRPIIRAFTCNGQLKVLSSAVARKPGSDDCLDDVPGERQTVDVLSRHGRSKDCSRSHERAVCGEQGTKATCHLMQDSIIESTLVPIGKPVDPS